MDETKAPGTSAVRSTPNQRRRKNARKQRYVALGILLTLFLFILVGIVLLILPAFKIKKITVKGNDLYTEEEVLNAAGIRVGDEILATDWDGVLHDVESLPYVRETNIKVRFFSVTIEVVEEPVLVASYGPYWYTLNNELRVLEISESEELLPPGTRITLPAVTGLLQNEILEFTQTEIDRSYIGELLETLDAKESPNRITALDVSQKFNLSFELEGNCRVILGSTENLETKLERAEQILAEKHSAGGYAEINVSDLKNTTYRPLSRATFSAV